MQLKETRERLNKFGKFVIKQARSRLTKGKKNVNKKLYNSLEYLPYQKGILVGVKFLNGRLRTVSRSGCKRVKRIKSTTKNPFSYKLRDSPAKSFKAEFVIRKGLKRNKEIREVGRFITKKSLQYMMVRSVFI